MEKQPKDTVGLQPTEPNTLYQKPTNHARRMPMEQNKSGGETMEDKILRIVRNDMVTNDGTYGIMEAPQMSRQSERSAS